MSDREKIIKRLRALLSLAENNDQAEEADSAMRQFNFLLEKYGLTKDEVVHDLPVGFKVTTVAWLTKKKTAWETQLAVVVANEHDCYAIIGQGIYQFIGQDNATQKTKYMFQQLQIRMSQEAKNRSKLRTQVKNRLNIQVENKGKHSTIAWQNSFLLGAVTGLQEQFTLRRQSYAYSNRNSTAIVTQTMPQVEEYLEEQYPDMPEHKNESKVQINSDAAWLGRMYGARLQIYQGITEGLQVKRGMLE